MDGLNVDQRDKEIEYLELKINELEIQLQVIARDSKSFRMERLGSECGHPIPNGNICSLCGSAKGVELKKGFDVYLCITCGEKWN